MKKENRFLSTFVLISIVFCFIFLGGCGGGFKDDSTNAKDIGESIFGPDSGR